MDSKSAWLHRGFGIRKFLGLVALLGSVSIVGCDGPAGVPKCSEMLGDWCWTYLGPTGAIVTAIAKAPGGILIGTTSGARWLRLGAGSWRRSGLDGLRVRALIGGAAATDPFFAAVSWGAGHSSAAVLHRASASKPGAWEPTDGGLAASGRTAAFSVARNPMNPQQLFLGLSAPILRSDDGGQSWTYVNSGPGDIGGGILALAVSAAVAGRVYAGGQDAFSRPFLIRSDDAGGAWTNAGPAFGPGEGAILEVLAIPQAGGELLVAASEAAVLISSDAGSSWTTGIAIAPASRVRMFVANAGDTLVAVSVSLSPGASQAASAVFVSTNHGSQWDTLPIPPGITQVASLSMTAGHTFYVGTVSGIWHVRRLH